MGKLPTRKSKIGKYVQDYFVFFLLFYLILFILENLFPGFVSNNFDLNLILVPVFILGVASAFFPLPKQKKKQNIKLDYLIIIGLAIITFIIIFSKTRDLGSISIVIALISSLLVFCVSLLTLFSKDEKYERK